MWHNPEMMKKSSGKGKAKAKAKARTKAAAKKSAPLVVARLEMPEDIRTELRGVMERMDAVTARMDAMHSDHEGLKKNIGLMAESVFCHNFAELMTRIGIPMKDSDIRANLRRDSNGNEYDIVGVNGDATVAAEVKFRVRRDDVNALHSKLLKFRGEFPEYARARLVGVVAGLSLDQGALKAAREYGFIVLKMDGATLSNQTPKGFRPKSY